MSKLIFTKEMFGEDCHVYSPADCVVKVQRVYDKWLLQQKKVYGCDNYPANWGEYDDEAGDTHSAILCCVESIEKKKCEHVLSRVRVDGEPWKWDIGPLGTFRCSECGIEIEPTGWKEVEG